MSAHDTDDDRELNLLKSSPRPGTMLIGSGLTRSRAPNGSRALVFYPPVILPTSIECQIVLTGNHLQPVLHRAQLITVACVALVPDFALDLLG